MNFFAKLKKTFTKEQKEENKTYEQGLTKTRDDFVHKLNLLGIKYSKVDNAYFDELEEILIEADIGVNTVFELLKKLKARAKEEHITSVKDLNNG